MQQKMKKIQIIKDIFIIIYDATVEIRQVPMSGVDLKSLAKQCFGKPRGRDFLL